MVAGGMEIPHHEGKRSSTWEMNDHTIGAKASADSSKGGRGIPRRSSVALLVCCHEHKLTQPGFIALDAPLIRTGSAPCSVIAPDDDERRQRGNDAIQ